MVYTFTKTERNNLKASTFETKSLLFLASSNKKYKDISVLTIDCFNDVAGMSDTEELWDVQAKGEKNLTPMKIGKYLITLYENHMSEFSEFYKEFIFFMPKLEERYLFDSSLSSYGFDNFKDEYQDKITQGLLSVCSSKQHVMDDFFKKVLFVEDRTNESTYIKGIMKFKSSKLNDQNFYSEMFKEIRDKQTVLKNSYIENTQVARPKEVLKLARHLTSQDLQVFVLNRLVGGDIFSKRNSIPLSYSSFVNGLDDEEIEDHIFKQNASLSKAFFDKSNQKNFWKLFESIFLSFSEDSRKKVSQVINELDEKLIERTEHMDMDSTRFLVAIVRDGLIIEN
ncbi:hypothetical protein [Shewanella dokdonensis]|uniref:hypothetical protein n=1 Tax=Shewanella dokdonensis TaxID=712036 RepID=UPI00200F9B62|nr:hypothetical protein [Shewanella dokdonensis]MCL1074512.1 hypothetical protein [Shewanella dokdonensis]